MKKFTLMYASKLGIVNILNKMGVKKENFKRNIFRPVNPHFINTLKVQYLKVDDADTKKKRMKLFWDKRIRYHFELKCLKDLQMWR